jgi:hypothetical protein
MKKLKHSSFNVSNQNPTNPITPNRCSPADPLRRRNSKEGAKIRKTAKTSRTTTQKRIRNGYLRTYKVPSHKSMNNNTRSRKTRTTV